MKDSLFAQASRIIEATRVPSAEEKEALTQRVLQEYPHTRPPKSIAGAEVDEDALRLQLYYLIRNDTKLSAGTGYPLRFNYQTNKALEDEWPLLIEVVVDRMKRLSSLDLSQMTPEEIMRANLADGVRLFIKSEGHGREKQDSKRWRLISALSIVDQLIDKVLHWNQNKTEILCWRHIPSCCGMGMDTPEDIDDVYNKVHKPTGGRISTSGSGDVTGFDWSVREWELVLEARQRVALAHAQGTAMERIAVNRAYAISRSVFVTDDGDMYAQEEQIYGVQKSGTFNTGSTNSRIRVFLAWLIGARWAIAMGDDSQEDHIPDAKERYRALGHGLKFYSRNEHDFEFCSHRFDGRTAVPSDLTKSMFKIMSGKEITPSQIAGFAHFARNHPRLDDALAAFETQPQLTAEAKVLLATRRNDNGKEEENESEKNATQEGGSFR